MDAMGFAQILEKLAQLHVRCPELRFGQLISGISTLAEDDGKSSLWDIEDTDFAAALDCFAADVANRNNRIVEPASAPASIIA